MSNKARELGYLIAGTLATYSYTQNGLALGVAVLAVCLVTLKAIDLTYAHRRRHPQTFGDLLEELNTNLDEVKRLLLEEIEPPLRKAVEGAQLILEDYATIIREVGATDDE